MSKLTSIVTKDGSTTLYNQQLDETYHSRHGAIQEAIHVFIKTGLEHAIKQNNLTTIKVFELGFGTGLNCLLTALWSRQNNLPVDYHSVESVKLSENQINQCNYIELISDKGSEDMFRTIHTEPWNKQVVINNLLSLHKYECEIEKFSTSALFDVIYFDAFGPRVQPELWEIDVLLKMFDLLNPGGYFVTYCAKGSVRRNLIEIGFVVERLPGPPGKREMLRGRKPN